MTKTEQTALKLAALRLRSLASSSDRIALSDPIIVKNSCALSPEIREAVRLYVTTWILPLIETVATDASKRDYLDKQLLSGVAFTYANEILAK